MMCVSFLPIFDSPGPKETHNHAMHTHIPEMSFAFIHHSSLSLCVSSANTLFCSLQDGMEAELMGLTTEDLETNARLLSNQSKVASPTRPSLSSLASTLYCWSRTNHSSSPLLYRLG